MGPARVVAVEEVEDVFQKIEKDWSAEVFLFAGQPERRHQEQRGYAEVEVWL
jgi:hypothetical protein